MWGTFTSLGYHHDLRGGALVAAMCYVGMCVRFVGTTWVEEGTLLLGPTTLNFIFKWIVHLKLSAEGFPLVP